MKKVNIYAIHDAILNVKFRSAWDNGVKAYAIDMLYTLMDFDPLFVGYTCLPDLEKALLNGAESWHDYSIGGMALICNSDICERLCTPSEKRIRRNGKWQPNRRETWIDVQTRALIEAWNLIAAAFWALQESELE